MTKLKKRLCNRFRGFLPVVIDVETAGFNPEKDALLELAAVILESDEEGNLYRKQTFHRHILPFPGANLEQRCLDFTGIDPYHPFRFAVTETEAIREMLQVVRQELKASQCHRAILVGHNSFFDLSFIKAAIKRSKIKRDPFHSFSSIDTVSLSAVMLGQTVLARATTAAGIAFSQEEAHSALYDAEKTADLFCLLVNRWQKLTDL